MYILQEFWRRKGGRTSSSAAASSSAKTNAFLFQSKSKKVDAHKFESAALLIQYTVRRWLAKRWMMEGGLGENRKSLTLRLQPHVISEEKARNLQHEIETWQHRNKVSHKNKTINQSTEFYLSIIPHLF